MLLLCSCLFGVFISYSGASVSLVTDNNMTSFQDGTEVVLICTISPYNNVMTWLVNNDPYADCFLGSCGASSNKPYTFIYNFDESNGKFKLTIESVNSTHAGLLFACDDGNERKTITFDVTTGDKDQNNTPITNTTSTTVGKSGPSDELCSTMDGDCIGLIIGCIIAVFWLIGLIGFCYNCCCNADMSEKDNCISCIIWLLCIPILGVIVMIYMYLDCKRCSNETGQLQETDEFYVSNTKGTSATVCWKKYNGKEQDKKYILRFSKVEPPKKIPDDVTSNTVMKYTVSPLKTSTNYEMNLKCVDNSPSENLLKQYKPLKLKTKGKPCPPQNFKKKVVTDSSITVRWTPGLDGDCQQTFHTAIFRKKDKEDPGQFDDILETDKRKIWLKTWTGLRPETEYDITLYAQNEIGKSTEQTLTIRTGDGKPEPPDNFEVSSTTETSITVKWTPGFHGGHTQTFCVTVNNVEYRVGENCVCTCGSLASGTYYDISLKATNEKGSVDAQKTIKCRTYGPPDKVTGFETVRKTNSTITVTWKPGHDGGFDQYFDLVDFKSKKVLLHHIDNTAIKEEHTITIPPKDTKIEWQVISVNKKGTAYSDPLTDKL